MTHAEAPPPPRGLRLWSIATVLISLAFLFHPARSAFRERVVHFVEHRILGRPAAP